MKHYLCKFIPPRADFLATMSADEKKWMGQHGVFLNDLLGKGIAPTRLQSEGFGQTKPIAPNETEDGRSLNRRVEFKILSGAD